MVIYYKKACNSGEKSWGESGKQWGGKYNGSGIPRRLRLLPCSPVPGRILNECTQNLTSGLRGAK